MSIGELALLVNDNFDKPLNQQLREISYVGAYLFTNSATFRPDTDGIYKIIVVGAGGETYVSDSYCSTGGAGGVAIKTMQLYSSQLYDVVCNRSLSSFNGDIIGNAGKDGDRRVTALGGSASGGDMNFKGNDGTEAAASNIVGASVGVFIVELMERLSAVDTDDSGYPVNVHTGYGILGHGASSEVASRVSMDANGGCVLVIPLEFN